MQNSLNRWINIINLIDPKVAKFCELCPKRLSQKRKSPLCVKCTKAILNGGIVA